LIFDKDKDDDGDCTDDPGTGSDRYFYCQQANYNVVALTDDTGTVVEKVAYDPYGEHILTLDGSTGNTLLFQGRRWDSEADLYYFRNRSYSPRLGRFLQRDPTGYGDGMNLYRYERCSPVCCLDPSGSGSLTLEECLRQVAKAANSVKHLLKKHMYRGMPKPYKMESEDAKWKHKTERRELCGGIGKRLKRVMEECMPPCDEPLPLATRIEIEALRRMYFLFCSDTPPNEKAKAPVPFIEWDALEDVANKDVQQKTKEWGWPDRGPASVPVGPRLLEKALEYAEKGLTVARDLGSVAAAALVVVVTFDAATASQSLPAYAF